MIQTFGDRVSSTMPTNSAGTLSLFSCRTSLKAAWKTEIPCFIRLALQTTEPAGTGLEEKQSMSQDQG